MGGKNRTKTPWWISSLTIWKIMYAGNTSKTNNIPWQIQTGISKALADKPFPSGRSKKIGREWIEEVTVYNVLYQLVCLVESVNDEEYFIIKTVRIMKNKEKIKNE